jgi:hypothetical protein
MRISNPVPHEVWESILSHLIPERETLRAVVHATCAASDEAQILFWHNDLSVCGLMGIAETAKGSTTGPRQHGPPCHYGIRES